MSPSCCWWYVWKHWWRTGLWRVFLDIEKCFDTINHDILLQKLKHYGIGGNAFDWFRDYLCGRRQRVRVDNITSELRPCPIGVPQGSILGPILYLLYVNEFPQYIGNQNCNIFADDAMIVRRAGLLWSQQDFEWRWSVPLFKCLTVLQFSFILFDLCLLITFFNFIMNYVPIVTFWIFTYHKIWILSIMFCFIWSYWIIYFLACL